MTPTVIPAIFIAKDQMTGTMARMSSSAKRFANEASARFSAAGKSAFAFGRKMALTGVLVAAPLVVAGKEAVKFEDKMSDIGKTTGLQGKELSKFGDDILQMSLKTRSSIDDLSTIAEIGGRLGIAQKDLKSFTVSANEFAVALGGDFSGGVESAITQFGKVTSLFRDTKNLDVASSLKKAGSAMNSLSAKGVNVEGLTDFSLRVGALPEVFRPSLASTTALGATLQKSGVDAQIASSGFSNFITTASQNLPMFAKAMGISTSEAQKLMNTDTAMFFAQFSAKMKGVPASELGTKLKGLKLNSLEVQKAIGAMSGSLDTYTELSKISNDQMRDGTSITEEYNTKNNNTAGQMAKLKNNMKALAITVGTALIPVINSLVQTIMPYLQAAGKWMQNNKGTVTTIVKVVAVVSALALGISAVSFAIGIYQKAVAIAKIVQIGWNLAMAASPMGLLIAGAVALGAVFGALHSAYSGLTMAQESDNEVRARALEKTLDQRIEVKELFNTLRKAKAGTDEYKNALVKIDAIQPGLTEKYKLQEKSIRNLNMAEKELVSTLMQKAMIEARAEVAKEKMKEAIRKSEGGAETDTWLQGIMRATGAGDEAVNKMKQMEAVGLMKESERLTTVNEQAKEEAANPEQAKQESTLKNTTNIVFEGLNDLFTAKVNGKDVATTGGSMKVNTGPSTR